MLREMTAVQSNANNLNAQDGPQTKSGFIIDGSWNPALATVMVQIGNTGPYEAPAFNDGLNQPLIVTASLVGGFPYAQYGPVGGELVQIWEDDSDGWVCAFDNAIPTATPQVKSGEFSIAHRSAQNTGDTVTFDVQLQATNDGDVLGDKAGGMLLGGGSLASIYTANGWTLELKDGAKKATLESPNGLVIEVDDNAGTISLGGFSLTDANGVVTKQDLQDAINALAELCQPGGGVTAPTVTASQTVLAKE